MATKIRLSNLTQPLDQDLSVPNLTASGTITGGNTTITGSITVSGGGTSTFDNLIDIRDDTNDTRIQFSRRDSGASAWVGIPSWNDDSLLACL